MGVSELYHMSLRLKNDLPWMGECKYFERVDSTQSRILSFLPKVGDGAVLILAEAQTKSVGRMGRAWNSPVGGLWFTLALPMNEMSAAHLSSFSMVAALQAAQSLQEVNNLDVQVKWPNDLIANGKKIGGILLGTTTKYKRKWFLIGMGINVNNALPAELAEIATSIASIRGQSQGRTRLLESILEHIHSAWVEYHRTGFGPYRQAVMQRLTGLEDTVQIQMGTQVIEGKLKGIDPQGSLLLESTTGTQTITAGEIVGLPA